jgi:hypothetical protein
VVVSMVAVRTAAVAHRPPLSAGFTNAVILGAVAAAGGAVAPLCLGLGRQVVISGEAHGLGGAPPVRLLRREPVSLR